MFVYKRWVAPSVVNNDWSVFPQAMKWKLLNAQTMNWVCQRLTTYPVGHFVWPHIRSAMLAGSASGRLSRKDDIARIFCEMRSPYCFLTPPQLKTGGKICTLSLEKWRENLGSPLLLLSGSFPRSSFCCKTNKMTCAHSEDLDQHGHSENGGNI